MRDWAGWRSVGYLDAAEENGAPVPGRPSGGAQNAAAVPHGGAIVATYAKHHLPTMASSTSTDAVPGEGSTIIRVNGIDIALAICEDIWQEGGPVASVRDLGAGLLLVINGSPYERTKDDTRRALCARRARDASCTLAYVNMVGSQDELVFDGGSMVVSDDGAVIARAFEFVEEVVVLDLDLPPERRLPTLPPSSPIGPGRQTLPRWRTRRGS